MAVIEVRAVLITECADCGTTQELYDRLGSEFECRPPGLGLVGTHRWKLDEPAIKIAF